MTFLLGLISGVLLLVIGEAVRRQSAARTRPELSLEVEPGLAPDRLAHPVAYARLAVHNAHGKDTAAGVSVRIDKARSAAGEDPVAKLAFLGGWPLAWSGADRGDQNVAPGFTAIAAGGRRLLDLAHLNQSVRGEIIVDVRPQPGNGMNYLGAGTYTFEIVVSADNAETRRYAAVLNVNGGEWDGDYETASKHLEVIDLRSV